MISPVVQDPPLLNFDAAAKLLGIDVSSVSRAVKAGTLRSVVLGGRKYLRRDWLVEWLSTPDNEPVSDVVNDAIDDYRARLALGVRMGVASLAGIEAPLSRNDDDDASTDGGIFTGSKLR